MGNEGAATFGGRPFAYKGKREVIVPQHPKHERLKLPWSGRRGHLYGEDRNILTVIGKNIFVRTGKY